MCLLLGAIRAVGEARSIGVVTLFLVIIVAWLMFDCLPLELICEILLICLQDLVVADRAGAVRIALVSRTVYRIVRPTLYHTLVITGKNARGDPNILEGVLSHVRYLCSTLGEPGAFNTADTATWAAYVVEHWCPASNGFLDAPWGFVSAYLEAAPGPRLDGVRINHRTIADAVRVPTS